MSSAATTRESTKSAHAMPGGDASLRYVAAVVLSGRLYGMVISLLTLGYLTRFMPKAQFGLYAFGISILYAASALGRFGFDRLILKLTAECVAKQAHTQYRILRVRLYSSAIATSLLSAVGLYLYLSHRSPMGGWSWIGPLAIACPIMAISQILAENFRGLGDSLRATAFDSMRTGPVVNTLFLLLVFATNTVSDETLTATRVLAVFAVSHSLMMTISAVSLARRKLSWKEIDTSAYQAPPTDELVTSAAPIAGTELVGVLTASADIWIAATFLSYSEVASLAAILQLGQIVVCPLTMASSAVLQHLAKLLAEGDRSGLQRMLRIAATLATIVAAGFVLAMAGAGDSVMSLFFGPQYAELGRLATIHCVGKFIFTASGIAGLLMVLSSRQHILFIFNLVFLAFFFSGEYLAASNAGLTGLVIAGSVLVSLQNIGVCLLAHRCLGIWTHCYGPIGLFQNAGGPMRLARQQK